MLEEKCKEKKINIIKPLAKKSIKETLIMDNSEEENEKSKENLDHLMRRSIYNQDLVLYSRVMIKKNKLYNDQYSQLSPEQHSDMLKELKNFNFSYEARKNFYLKKNKLLEKVDDKFHSLLLEKKGTFYNDFKKYKGKDYKESEVVLGSKDILSQNPDLFKYEKFDENFSQKVSLLGSKPKKTEIAFLNEFKEGHSRLRNKSLDRPVFITPFQSNVAERVKQKHNILSKIEEYKHKNLNLEALIKTENLTNKYQDRNDFDLINDTIFAEKDRKLNSFITARNAKSNLNVEICKKENGLVVNKEKIIKGSESVCDHIHNNKDKNLNYLIFDRNKNSFSANIDSTTNKLLSNINNNSDNLNLETNIFQFNINKNVNISQEKERKKFLHKELTQKNVLENPQNLEVISKYSNNNKKSEVSEDEVKEYKQNKIKHSEKIMIEKDNQETVSPMSKQCDAFNLNEIIRNENNKQNFESVEIIKEKSKNKINFSNVIIPNDCLIQKIDKKELVKLRHINNGAMIYLPNPFNLQKRFFDNRDIDLDKERKHNVQLSYNQNKSLIDNDSLILVQKLGKSIDNKTMKSKNDNTYKNKVKKIDKQRNGFEKIIKYNNKIEIDAQPDYNKIDIKIENENAHDYNDVIKDSNFSNIANKIERNEIAIKENLNINSLLKKELPKEKNKFSISSNQHFSSGEYNSHILGALFYENKNKLKSNLNIDTNNSPSYNLNEDRYLKNDMPINSNKSRNLNNNLNNNSDSDSYKFSNHSSFELENNIIEVKSKYKNNDLIKNHNKISSTKIFENTDLTNKYNTDIIFNLKDNGYKNVIFKNTKNKMDINEIKNAKINQTLNENVFKDVKKNIINLNYPIREEIRKENSLSKTNNNDLKINFTRNNLYSNESQTNKNMVGKKLINRNRSVITSSALILQNTSNNEHNTSRQSSRNYTANNNNSYNIICNNEIKNKNNDYEHSQSIKNRNLFLTNFSNNKNHELEQIKSNQENISTKNSNVVIYTNNIQNNLNFTKSKQEINLIQPEENLQEPLSNESVDNLPSARNTSNSKILKSKSRIFSDRESPFRNAKIKKVLENKSSTINSSSQNNLSNIDINHSIYNNTKNAALVNKNKIDLEFKYPPGSNRNKINKKKSSSIVNNINSNSNLDNENNIINFIYNPNNKKKIVKKSNTIIESNYINRNDSSISDQSRGKKLNSNENNEKLSRSNSRRNSFSPIGKREKNMSLNINVKESPQYFLNRNIFEEYEKIKSHSRNSSENQIIFSELKYKLDIIYEKQGNFTNLFNEEIIKGNLVDNTNLILPKI